jgi:apolipoprotein N-acyltransferase
VKFLPSWKNALLALLAVGLLILAFPDFEYWFLAWFALVPLMWAVEREKGVLRSFILGWLFGTAFFFGTCWWLAYAPIHYASFPPPLAYLLVFIVCLISGIFPGVFAAILAVLLRRFGLRAYLAAPFVWVFTEFLRYWITGNNWNAIGYSQAFTETTQQFSKYGGVLLVSCICLLPGAALLAYLSNSTRYFLPTLAVIVLIIGTDMNTVGVLRNLNIFEPRYFSDAMPIPAATVIAVQPNVPMTGLDSPKWEEYRRRQFVAIKEQINSQIRATSNTLGILPESPMNFMYNDDREFQQFVRDFTTRNNVSLLFNSAEPDATNGKYFNSAVMVGPDGNEIAQYDKIYLLPFGEAVPVPFESLVPAFVGNFSYGREYDLLPLGDAKAGVMICFESHFGQLSREYVRNGADAIIEMTNDGYLGPTPVLRQHLANAVFRAVETNRPVLRVTNVGITAYIDERGNVHDPLLPYSEGTRVWTVSKSDGTQTFYVKYGDWFAWLCTVVTIGLILISFRRRTSEISDK